MKYRLKVYDIKNDQWMIQKKYFIIWLYYSTAGVGDETSMSIILRDLNNGVFD